jgi:hypothetical protein
LRWYPTNDDLGTYELLVTATDGQFKVAQTFTVEVSEGPRFTRDEWTSYLLPGIGYSYYAPRIREQSGTFQGLEIELLFAGWIHRNENRGPSHGRVYLNAELLNSSDPDVPILFTYAFGFSLSLERNPRRNFLIPNYGLDIGHQSHDDLGSRFQATPYAGLHLYSARNFFLSARLGYRLVPSDMERLAGLHAGAAFNFSVW